MWKREYSQQRYHPGKAPAGKPKEQRLLYVAALLLVAGLSGCHPVETWRNITGASKNEPNPQTTPNTKNLAAGAKMPYPNLATVPPPPTRGLTEAAIKKLTRSLLADRANARYTAEKLAAGAPLPPAPPPAIATASSPSGFEKAANGKKSGAGAGEKPQPGPMESSLTMPRIPSPPQPEAAVPPPPPPHLMPPAKAPAASLAALPRPQQPAPPPLPSFPLLSPKPPPLAATAQAAKKALPAKPVRLAAITFPAGQTNLSPAIKKQITTAASRLRNAPGTLRVVTYAAGGGGALAELNSFSAALAEGQAVAGALKAAGIPQKRIKVEASPTKMPLGLSRVEIYLVP